MSVRGAATVLTVEWIAIVVAFLGVLVAAGAIWFGRSQAQAALRRADSANALAAEANAISRKSTDDAARSAEAAHRSADAAEAAIALQHQQAEEAVAERARLKRTTVRAVALETPGGLHAARRLVIVNLGPGFATDIRAYIRVSETEYVEGRTAILPPAREIALFPLRQHHPSDVGGIPAPMQGNIEAVAQMYWQNEDGTEGHTPWERYPAAGVPR